MAAVIRRLLLAAFAAAAGCSAVDGDLMPRANLITGGSGSDWDRIGSAVAQLTNANFEGQPVTAIPGAGGVSNPARVGRLPGDFGISFLSFLRAATRGEPPYREPFPELRHVATLLQNKLHLIAGPSVDVTTLEDVVRRRLPVRVGTGLPGSAEEFLLRESLAILGATYADLRQWGGRVDLLGSGERADLFRDGHIDIIAFHSADPSATITELMVSHQGTFLSLGEDVRSTLRERWEVQSLVLPAGRYKNLEADVQTVGLEFGIFATADVRDELVYQMVKSIDASVAYLGNVHVGFRQWDPRRMAYDGGVAIHPGALRFFREKGWIQ